MNQPEHRELNGRDLESLLELYAHLHADDEAPPDEAAHRRVWSQINADPNQSDLGAFVAGRLVAACNAAVIPNLTRGARPYAVIENVVTHSEFRRGGIGVSTLKALIEWCWNRNCYKTMLMSGAGRAQDHEFYRRAGFDRDAKQAFLLKRPGSR